MSKHNGARIKTSAMVHRDWPQKAHRVGYGIDRGDGLWQNGREEQRFQRRTALFRLWY
jgi:hypothetical protein